MDADHRNTTEQLYRNGRKDGQRAESYPLENGEGCGAERVFVTREKLDHWLYRPVGDEVEVVYNRYGKCQEIVQRGVGK